MARARLLGQTSLTVLQVAVACGFTSASHFTKCYRTQFGVAPKRERAKTEVISGRPHAAPDDTAGAPDDLDEIDPGAEEVLAVELSVLGSVDPDGEGMPDRASDDAGRG